MSHRPFWGIAVFALVLALLVGVASYDAGVTRGYANAGVEAAQAPGQPTPLPPYASDYYGWHRHHGPFPFFFLGPVIGFFFVMFVLRTLFWGFRCRPHWYGHSWHRRGYDWEEWHRRAHERMKDSPADADHSGR